MRPTTGDLGGQHEGHPYREYARGASASASNIVLTFPINKVVFRQQLAGCAMTSAVGQLAREGLVNLYRGLTMPLLARSIQMALMFGVYDNAHSVLVDTRFLGGTSPFVLSLMAGCVSGTAEAVLMPFERVQTLMQIERFHSRFETSHVAFRYVATQGLGEMYRGWSAILLRNGPSSALFFACREPMYAHMDTQSAITGIPYAKAACDFIAGGFLGASISTITYPLNVAKVQMQCTLGGPPKTLHSTVRTLFKERGRDVFKGGSVNFVRSLLSWGIVNAVYEITADYL